MSTTLHFKRTLSLVSFFCLALLSIAYGQHPASCDEPASYQFISVKNGSWTNGSTWAGGVSPGDPETLSNKRILITHNVTYSKMKLQGNVKLVIKDGGQLIGGQMELEGSGDQLIVKNAKLDMTAGSSNLQVKNSGSSVCGVNACIWVAENFQNIGSVYFSNAGVRVGVNSSGNFENNGGTISGNDLRVWLPNGNLQRNSGSWPGSMISHFRVSGGEMSGLTVPEETSVPAIQNYTSETCAPRYSIIGTVFNDNDAGTPNGDAMSGITVTLSNGATTTTDASGVYTFTNLPAGNYTVSVSLPAGTPPFQHVSSTDATPTNGNTVVAVTNANITGVNFGVNQPPTPSPTDLAPQVNPGGTNSISVPASNFGGTDPNSGQVVFMTITSFTNATSLIINGTSYSSAAAIQAAYPGGIPTNTVNGQPTPAIRIDPVDGAVTSQISYTLTDNATLTSSPGTVSVPFIVLKISGNVWNDANGDAIINNGEPNTVTDVANETLTIYVSSSTGEILAKTDVLGDGTFSTPSPGTGAFTVTLSNDASLTIGSIHNLRVASILAAIPTTLPNDPLTTTIWVNTGTNFPGSGANANDGAFGTITVTNTDVTEINFGIERLPDSHDVTVPVLQQPTPGDIFKLDGSTGNWPALNGNDPEDGSYTGNVGSISNPQGVHITALPNNGTLLYNNVAVTAADVSNKTLFTDPSLFSLWLTGSNYSYVAFEYAYVDAAGKEDITPAIYQASFSQLPVKLIRFSAKTEQNVVNLTWATTEESNSRDFEVQHSVDGEQWKLLTTIAAKGDSKVTVAYSHTHHTPSKGTNLYRLRMIDQDETFAYSRVISATLTQTATPIFIYPNPSKESISLGNISTTSIRTVEILNTYGKVVYQTGRVTAEGINIESLNNGVYFVKIHQVDGSSSLHKIVVAK
jgi:hypothetical protein